MGGETTLNYVIAIYTFLNVGSVGLDRLLSARCNFRLYYLLYTRVTRSCDRAQLRRQIVNVKEWKTQVEPIGVRGSEIVWLEHDKGGKERVVKKSFKATTTTPLRTDYKRELQALGRLSIVSSKNSY